MDKRLSPVYKNKMDFVEENILDNIKLLDVGCGEGNYFHLYEDLNIDYKGIDIDCPETKNTIKCGAEKLPFKDKSFDMVVCMDVLEHVEDPFAAISEIHRVLKKKGELIMSVPNYYFPWTYDPINAFLRMFNLSIPIGMWAWGHRRLYPDSAIVTTLMNALVIEEGLEISDTFFRDLAITYQGVAEDQIKKYSDDASFSNLKYDREAEENGLEVPCPGRQL